MFVLIASAAAQTTVISPSRYSDGSFICGGLTSVGALAVCRNSGSSATTVRISYFTPNGTSMDRYVTLTDCKSPSFSSCSSTYISQSECLHFSTVTCDSAPSTTVQSLYPVQITQNSNTVATICYNSFGTTEANAVCSSSGNGILFGSISSVSSATPTHTMSCTSSNSLSSCTLYPATASNCPSNNGVGVSCTTNFNFDLAPLASLVGSVLLAVIVIPIVCICCCVIIIIAVVVSCSRKSTHTTTTILQPAAVGGMPYGDYKVQP